MSKSKRIADIKIGKDLTLGEAMSGFLKVDRNQVEEALPKRPKKKSLKKAKQANKG